MDQFDLFNTAADTPFTAADTPQPAVVHIAPKPAVETTRNDTLIGRNPNGIFAFALKESRRMWAGEQHRRRSLEQLERFCRLTDNDSLNLADITPDIVHEFIDHIAQPVVMTLKDGSQKKKPGASEATQNRYTATISKVMKTAAQRQKIDEAPSFHFYQEDTESRPRFYTPEEVLPFARSSLSVVTSSRRIFRGVVLHRPTQDGNRQHGDAQHPAVALR